MERFNYIIGVDIEMQSIQREIGLDDLYKFMRIGNKSLLIKGRSGTGKVTLGFELARMYKDTFRTVFITRKADELALYKRYPWIREFINKDNILSLSDSENILTDSPLFSITNLLNVLTNLTIQIEDPFITLKSTIKPLVILDVWNSITSEMDLATSIKIEKALLSLTEKHIGFIIFITEDLEKTTLEHLVDGIVRLDYSFYKSYRLREMIIEKLKGTLVLKPRIPFTLEGGRFRTFSTLSHEISENPTIFECIKHPVNYYSTGNQSLDEKLNGGFKRGSIISLEVDKVDRFVFIPLLAPLVLNFIEQEDAAMVISSQDQHVHAVTRYLIPHIEEGKHNNLVVIGSDVEESEPYIVSITSKTFMDIYDTWLRCYKDLKRRFKHCVITIDYSFVELEYEDNIQDILKSIIDLCRIIRANRDLLVIISRPHYKTLEVIKSVSDLHLRIFEYNGAIMLAAVKPQLFLCNIQTDYSKGYPNARLLEST